MPLWAKVTLMCLPEPFLAAILLASIPERLEFFNIFAAHSGLLVHGFEPVQRFHSRHYHIVDVGAAHGFGEDILHANGLHDRAHSTAGDYAGAGGGGGAQKIP